MLRLEHVTIECFAHRGLQLFLRCNHMSAARHRARLPVRAHTHHTSVLLFVLLRRHEAHVLPVAHLNGAWPFRDVASGAVCMAVQQAARTP